MAAIDLSLVRSWAEEAGALAVKMFNVATASRKPDRTWVTEADVAVEKLLVERIRAAYPDHGIVGEEATRDHLEREFVWALDPIDGTGSFVAGLPTWGVSIGLLRNGASYAGVLNLPLVGDMYWAEAGGGAFMNGQQITVNDPDEWDGEDWISIPSESHRDYQITFPGKTRALGATIASFAYVARGSAIGGLIAHSALWDVAASMVILNEAGGVAIAADGTPLDTAILLNGGTFAAPALLAAPRQIDRLRAVITPRR